MSLPSLYQHPTHNDTTKGKVGKLEVKYIWTQVFEFKWPIFQRFALDLNLILAFMVFELELELETFWFRLFEDYLRLSFTFQALLEKFKYLQVYFKYKLYLLTQLILWECPFNVSYEWSVGSFLELLASGFQITPNSFTKALLSLPKPFSLNH